MNGNQYLTMTLTRNWKPDTFLNLEIFLQAPVDKFKPVIAIHTDLNVKILALREKCPNAEFFLVRIFLYSA